MADSTGKLVSRVDYPIEVVYDGQGSILPPRGKLEKIDGSKISKVGKGAITDINKDLPNGVIYIP